MASIKPKGVFILPVVTPRRSPRLAARKHLEQETTKQVTPVRETLKKFILTRASSLSSDTEMDSLSTVCHCVLGIDDLSEVFSECKNFSEDWKFIGLNLGVKKVTLDNIKKDCDDVKERMLEMLASWLNGESQYQPIPSWHILLKTLSEYDITQTTQIASKFVCNHK